MKHITKILYIAIFLLYSCSSENQSRKSEKELMVTFQDSLSYSMGVNIGTNLPETDINQDLLIEGLQDYWNKAEPRLDASSRNEILRTFNIMNSELDRDNMKAMGERAMKLSRENKMKGQEFLDKNKTSEGVRVFNRSQIQYKVIAEGNGKIPDLSLIHI